jgi:tRNA pseudouridine38-40 synthase
VKGKNMQNYKMVIGYDGKRYKGYRKIKGEDDKTIQGKIERILKKLYETDVETISAVNTDPGTSATHQVINFKAPTNKYNEKAIYNNLEEFLPDDIIVMSIEQADERFHSRYNVQSITYTYRLWKKDAPHRPLFERYQVKTMEKPLDVALMQEGAKLILGEHDFKAFSTNAKANSTVKTVQDLTIKETETEVVITMSASGYLLNMERYIVGTLVQIGLHERGVNSIEKAFQYGAREYVGHKAMVGALCLEAVTY